MPGHPKPTITLPAAQTQTGPGGPLGQGKTGGQDRLPDALGWW